MQRYYDVVRDQFGNPAPGVSVTVYLTGTTTLASIYLASSSSDSPSTTISNPIVTGSDGAVAFAANDGDYDIYYNGSSITPFWRYRYNLFDSTTATTVPVSSIALAMPGIFSVAGSPGTSITVSLATETANTIWAGPTSGGAAAPTFRALVAADITPIAVDKSTAQTAIAGTKSWDGAQTFNAAVTHASTFTQTGTSTFNADVTFGTNADLVFDKTSKGCIGTAGTYGYQSKVFTYDGSTGAGTAPTITVLQSGLRFWAYSAAATNEQMYRLSMPYDYAEGTDIIPYITWTTGGTNAGTVRWGLEYTIVKGYNQATMPANTTIYVETAGSGTALKPVTSSWAAITGTVLEPGALVLVRVFRDGAHANDTQTDVSYLLDFGVKFQLSRPFGAKNSTPPFYS